MLNDVPFLDLEQYYAVRVRTSETIKDFRLIEAFFAAAMRRYDVEPTGVIHVGGHVGQELVPYAHLGFQRILFLEPQPIPFEKLRARVRDINETAALCEPLLGKKYVPHAVALQLAASESRERVTFWVSGNTQLSSMSEPDQAGLEKTMSRLIPFAPMRARLAAKIFGFGKFTRTTRIEVETDRLDDIVAERTPGWKPEDFTVLRVNTQGAELRVLAGAPKVLASARLAFLEVNFETRYQGQPSIDALVTFMSDAGFKPVLGSRLGPVGDVLFAR